MSEKNVGTKKRGTLFHIMLILLCACAFVFVGALAYRQAERSRILSDEHKNASSWSVDSSYEAEIGGITQYIRVKGDFSKNPLLLVFPDYPGKLSASSSYMIPDGLEQRFVVVTWDMRGTGVTRSLNPETEDFNYMKISSDAAEICDFVLEKLERENEKVYILGYSFGSVCATDFCRQYPSYVEGYIGISQVCGLKEGMSDSFMKFAEEAMFQSTKKFNEYMDAERLLMDKDAVSQEDFLTCAELLGYGTGTAPTGYSLFVSPYCSFGDINKFDFPDEKNEAFYQSLMGFDSQKFGYCFQNIPVLFICGSEDRLTPSSFLSDHVNPELDAIKIIEGGGHELLFDHADEILEIIDEAVSK